MPGIVPTRIPRDHTEPLRQDIDNLALALIAPLGAHHYRCLCSHFLFLGSKTKSLFEFTALYPGTALTVPSPLSKFKGFSP
jgi:hypothetical protein